MSDARRVFANTVVLGAGQAISQLANLAFVMIFARAYGAEVLGWYSVAMAVGAVAAVLAAGGTRAMLVRDLAARPENAAVAIGRTLPVQLSAALLLWTVLVGGTWYLTEDPLARQVIAAVVAYHLLVSAGSLLLVPFNARQRMWLPAAMDVGQKVGIALVALALIAAESSAATVAAVLPLTAFGAGLLALAAVSRLMGRRPTGLTELSESLALYARARPFLGLALIVALYGRAGTLVLSITSDAATVGLFAAAERLTLLVSVLQGVIASAVLPALGALVEHHPGRALAVARSSMRLLMVCVIPAGGALILFSEEALGLLYGPEFVAASPVLVILTLVAMTRSTSALQAVQAMALHLQRQLVQRRAVALGVFLLLGAPLSLEFGATGLAAAALAVEAGYSLSLRRQLARRRFSTGLLRFAWRPALAVAAGVAVDALLWTQPLDLRLAATAVAMATVLLASGAVRLRELQTLRSV